MKDNWEDINNEMVCRTCMYFLNFRCRRNAPTMKGWPSVYTTDWCGDHKLSKVYMSDKTYNNKNTDKLHVSDKLDKAYISTNFERDYK